MKIALGTRRNTIEEIRCHNEMVEFFTRAVNAGIIVLEANDKLPELYTVPETAPCCPSCGEKDLKKLSLLYYERIYRAFCGFSKGGEAMVGDWDGGCDMRRDVPREEPLSNYWISCQTCEAENPMPEGVKYVF